MAKFWIFIDKPDHTLPHGLSLFADVISESRDCNSSSIPDMFYSCNEEIELKDFEVIETNKTVPKIVEKINEKTAKVRNNCSEYEFQSIHKLYERVLNPTDNSKSIRTFIIHVYLNPGKALFETIVRLTN